MSVKLDNTDLEGGSEIELLCVLAEHGPGGVQLEEVDIGVNLLCYLLNIAQ